MQWKITIPGMVVSSNVVAPRIPPDGLDRFMISDNSPVVENDHVMREKDKPKSDCLLVVVNQQIIG
jgi:hypothetical protein